VAAPQTTLDRHCPNGAAIPIEQRAAAEVTGGGQLWRGTVGADGGCRLQSGVRRHACGLVSGWVLDSGVVTPAQVAAGAFAPDNG
jgi:methylthioribose-1-phosphate isomerase